MLHTKYNAADTTTHKILKKGVFLRGGDVSDTTTTTTSTATTATIPINLVNKIITTKG